MTLPVEVRFTIPTQIASDRGSGTLQFSGWLPLAKDNSLEVADSGMVVRYSIDASCVGHLDGFDADNMGNYVNIIVDKVICTVSGLSTTENVTELAAAMGAGSGINKLNELFGEDAVRNYSVMSREAYAAAIRHYNRFVGYVRAAKGQSWLKERAAVSGSLYAELHALAAKARIADGPWFDLTAPPVIEWQGMVPSQERCIVESDWAALCNHVQQGRKPPLVGQLLANAEEHLRAGHERAAVTESVSALEFAVHQFAKKAKSELWASRFSGRVQAGSLAKHVEHLGFTATISYLFPVILPEEHVPLEVIQACRDAIEERNNVVHNGKRQVDPAAVWRFLKGIRSLCAALRTMQEEAD